MSIRIYRRRVSSLASSRRAARASNVVDQDVRVRIDVGFLSVADAGDQRSVVGPFGQPAPALALAVGDLFKS
jgi:hypothetical protein